MGVIPTRMFPLGVGHASAPTSLDYVQDAAILFFDGIENAGRGVHNGSATNWTDLSPSGANAAPYGGCDASWTSDSLSFTETGNFRAPLSSITWPSGGITIELAIRQNRYGTWAGRVVQTEDTSNKRFDLCVPRVSTDEWGKQIVTGSSAYNINLSKQYPPMAQTFAITLSTTANNAKFRWNGQTENVTTYGRPSAKPSYFCIGGNYNDSRNFLGEVCAFRFHSRTLTDAEIDANAALDRERFNVT